MTTIAANQIENQQSNITIASDGKVIRRKSTSALLLSLVILAVGIVLIFVASEMTGKTGPAYSAALIFGVSGAGIGLCMLLFGGKQWYYMPTKSKIVLQSINIDPIQLDAVAQAVEMRDPSLLRNKLKNIENAGARIDLYTSADGKFAAAQVFRYVPHSYTPATAICCAYDQQAEKLAGLLQ